MPYKQESMLMGGDAPHDTSTALGFDPANGPFNDDNVVTGEITRGDEDWIAIEMSAGTTYTITVGGGDADEGELNDSVLKLLDSKGGLIDRNDDQDGAKGMLGFGTDVHPGGRQRHAGVLPQCQRQYRQPGRG